MNLEAQLVASLRQFNKEALENNIRFYYGKVVHVNYEEDTCRVKVQEEGLEAVVNLRVGQQELSSSFVIYPKKDTRILFLSENESFGRAYMLTCSEVAKVKIIVSPSEATTNGANTGETAPLIELNGNAMGGLIKIDTLTTQINAAICQLNSNIEALETATTTHVHAGPGTPATGPPDPNAPPSATPPPNPTLAISISGASLLSKEDYENKSVTHDGIIEEKTTSDMTDSTTDT